MLFLLKKIIGTALMPLSLVLLLQLLALALLSRRKRRAAATSSIAGILLLMVATNEGLANWLVHRLERQNPPVYLDGTGHVPPPFATAKFIAVLGSGHTRDPQQSALGRLSPSGLSRLTEAVRLARLLPDARLLVCGPVPDDGPPAHATILARAAVELGIERDRITELPAGLDTHDEAHEIKAVAGEEPVLIVTSAWHMPRAIGLARGADLNALPAPADYAIAPIGNPGTSWFRFSVFGLERSTIATREYLGLAWTRLRGQR